MTKHTNKSDGISLKQARKENKLDEFIKEHDADPKGDLDEFDRMLDTMTHPEKLKSTQETSSQDSDGS